MAPPRQRENWSAPAAGDLGLKAAYWVDDSKQELYFAPIVAWFACNAEMADHGFFAPLVLSSAHWPTLATIARDLYAGIYPVAMSEDEALEDHRRIFGPGPADIPVPNKGLPS